MRKDQDITIKERVQSKAIEILNQNRDGLRFGNLARRVKESLPDLKKLTIDMYVQRLATDKHDKICKPSRGFFRIKNGTEPEKVIQSLPREKKEISREFEKRISELSQKARTLFEKIPKDGSSVTNQSLRYSLRRSGFSYDDYYNFRKELLEKGLIALGRGRGGTVSRVLEKPEEFGKPSPKEYELYDAVKKWLEDDENRNIKDEKRKATVFSAVTASPTGYRRKSGLWSRPDIVLVVFDEYPRLTQSMDMTVKSYEVKTVGKYDITAVYEAASHQKGAHYSYLVVALPGTQGATEPPPQEVEPLLERFGVGLAWFYKTGKDTYDMNIVLEAERQNPAPVDQNEIVNNFYEKLETKEQNVFDRFIRGR